MDRPRDDASLEFQEWAARRARELYVKNSNDIEVDDRPPVSSADDGTWVAAWVWVPYDE